MFGLSDDWLPTEPPLRRRCIGPFLIGINPKTFLEALQPVARPIPPVGRGEPGTGGVGGLRAPVSGELDDAVQQTCALRVCRGALEPQEFQFVRKSRHRAEAAFFAWILGVNRALGRTTPNTWVVRCPCDTSALEVDVADEHDDVGPRARRRSENSRWRSERMWMRMVRSNKRGAAGCLAVVVHRPNLSF